MTPAAAATTAARHRRAVVAAICAALAVLAILAVTVAAPAALVPGGARPAAADELTVGTVLRGRLDVAVLAGSARLEPEEGDPCLVGPTVPLAPPTLPAGATIQRVELVWAASGPPDPDVVLDGVPVTADALSATVLAGGPAGSGRADVTGRVELGAPLELTGLDVDAGPERCAADAVFAGAALVVVYAHPDLPRRAVVVHHGLAPVGGAQPVLVHDIADGLPVVPGAGRVIGLVWEGDAFGVGEDLVTGKAEPDPGGTRWDGVTDAGGEPRWGVDVDETPLGPGAAGEWVLRVTSGADQVLLGGLVVVVDDVTRPPVAADDELHLTATGPTEVDVVANDRLPDAPDDPAALATATVAVTAWPEIVSVVVDGSGLVVEAPPGFTGRDRVGYAVCDLPERCGTGVLEITADLADDRPPLVRQVPPGAPVPVEAAALDPGLDLSRLAVVDPPSHGTVEVDGAAGVVVYRPSPGWTGPDTFSYAACGLQGPEAPCRARVVEVRPRP